MIVCYECPCGYLVSDIVFSLAVAGARNCVRCGRPFTEMQLSKFPRSSGPKPKADHKAGRCDVCFNQVLPGGRPVPCSRCGNGPVQGINQPPASSRKRQPTARKSPYMRIMEAARRGTGVRLSAGDVIEMSMDTAIAELAMNDEEQRDLQAGGR